MCLPGYKKFSDLTDEEIVEVLELYDICELVSSEEDIDFLMKRWPALFPVRFKRVSYTITEEDREHFKKLEEEAIAVGLDLSLEF